MVGYAEIGYEATDTREYDRGRSREEVVMEVIGKVRGGEVNPARMGIRRGRRLGVDVASGVVSVCVNGHAGRRTVCVLGGDGMELETLDMEGEAEDEEV